MPRLIDISPEISPEIAVFPGDTPFQAKILVDHSLQDHFRLSSITLSPHTGAHADAPNHYSAEGVGISERDLNYYYGPCQVIEVSLKPNERIRPATLQGKSIQAERVLFKTGSFRDTRRWRNDFNALSPELIDFLHERGVKLVGIDTPSVDLAEDKILATHLKIFEHNLANLEGLTLEGVREGLYQLIALPLKIRGGDASPVRAVLVAEE